MNEKVKSLIQCGSMKGDESTVTEPINSGQDDLNEDLCDACFDGDVTCVITLLKDGAEVNCKTENGHTPLIFASQNGHLTIVIELLKHQANVNLSDENGNTALHYACINGYFTSYTIPTSSTKDILAIVSELLEHGADANFRDILDYTPLHFACQYANRAIVKELINYGGDVNFKSQDDNIPLHASSSVDIACELLKHGSDINLKNKDDHTPIHLISFAGRSAIVSELVKCGANVNCKDKNDDTPLHLASTLGHVTTVTNLIHHCADINCKNLQNETPLYYATWHGYVNVIMELLKHGGDLNFKIDSEKSFLSWASEIGYDLREYESLLEPLQKKILSDYIFSTLSELYFYSLPEALEPIMQKAVLLFINFYSLSALYPYCNDINQKCDIEIFFNKLFGFGFMKEFIYSFENIIKSEKMSSGPSEINFPCIGIIMYDELFKIASQYYDLPNNFCNLFVPNFQQLFKFASTSKSHDFKITLFNIFGPDFTKDYQVAVEYYLEANKNSLSFLGLKHNGIEIFSKKIVNEILAIVFLKVLSKIGGTITGAMIGCIEPNLLKIYKDSQNNDNAKITSNHNIVSVDDASSLQQELIKSLVHNFIKHFQPPHIKFYNSFEYNSCSAALDMQGSAGEGFLIYGKDQSDIDFIYPLTIFNTFIIFNKLLSCPDAPAYVMIEVAPNLSECQNELERKLLLENLNFSNESYYLNIKHLKQSIDEHIRGKLNFSSNHQALINPDDDKCFRIQFFYNVIPVIINHLTSHITNLSKLSESFIQNKDSQLAVELFLKDISGNYYVSQKKWNFFKRKLRLYKDALSSNSSHQQGVQSSVKQNHLKIEVFNINIEIETKIHIIIDNIIASMQFLNTGMCDVNFKFWANIEEEIFYVLIFILISWGLNTIIPVILNKNINFKPQPGVDMKINCILNEPVFFFTEDIYQIRNKSHPSIISKEITQKQKEIEIYIIASLIWITDDLDKIYINLNKKESSETMLSDTNDYTFHRNEDITNKILTNEISWHSSMLLFIIEFLKIGKTIIKYNSMFNPALIEEQKHMFEVVPGLKFEEWPIIASSWITRARQWPEPSIIQRIINNGIYVVFKSFKKNGYDGRISFSGAEKIICHAMTKEQRSVSYFLKKTFKLIDT